MLKTNHTFTYKGILVKHVDADAANSVERELLQRVLHVGDHHSSLARSVSLLRGRVPGFDVGQKVVDAVLSATAGAEVVLVVGELLLGDLAGGTRFLVFGV